MKRPRPITGTHLFQRERCARWVWLDFHGEAAQKLPPDTDAAAAMAFGRRHENEIVAKLSVVEPEYPPTDFDAGALATSDLMRSGAPLIYQGVLQGKGKLGKPDLLRRIDNGGDSPQYIIGDIKASSAPKLEHAMQLAFYGDMLSQSHPESPPRAFLILGSGREAEVRLDEIAPLYREALTEVEAIHKNEHKPRPLFGRHCGGCQWRGVCLPEMEERGDLTLVHGVTAARRLALEAVGVHTITQLATSEAASIAERTELPRETVRRFALQARALLDHAPHRLAPLTWKPARIAWSVALARDPAHGHICEFLGYRTVALESTIQEAWIQEHAATPADEGAAYRRFLDALARDRDAPIYHYGADLPDSLSQLDVRHGRLNDPLPLIFARLQDVQVGIRSSLVLPIRRYDLGSVAGALGIAPPEQQAESAATGESIDISLALRRKLAGQVLLVRRVRLAATQAWKADSLITSMRIEPRTVQGNS